MLPCNIKNVVKLLCFLFVMAETGYGYYLQDKSVLAIGFEQQGNLTVPEPFRKKIEDILREKKNVRFIPHVIWRIAKFQNREKEYLKGISNIIEGSITMLDTEKGKIRIFLSDSLKNPLPGCTVCTFDFRNLNDMTEKFEEGLYEIFYYMRTGEHRKKVDIIKFVLVSEGLLHIDLGSEVPKMIAGNLEDNDLLKTAFDFNFVGSEFDKWVINSENNVLTGKIKLSTRDALNSDLVEIDVEIIFYQGYDRMIIIKDNPPFRRANNYKRLIREIEEELKKMMQSEVDL